MAGAEDNVGWAGVVISAVLLIGFALLLIYSLVVFWPLDPGSTGNDVQFLWWEARRPSITASLFLLVVLAGGIGGSIHAVRSLSWYVGNRNLRYSWLLMYFSLPVVGAMLALITYVVLRGGLISNFSASEDVNPYGVVAVAALVGLFSREAADKLRSVFEALLTPAEQGKDPAIELTIADAQPRSGSVGDLVKLKGTGLSSATSVAVGNVTTKLFQKVSDNELEFSVPAGSKNGAITVTGPSGTATSSFQFTVV